MPPLAPAAVPGLPPNTLPAVMPAVQDYNTHQTGNVTETRLKSASVDAAEREALAAAHAEKAAVQEIADGKKLEMQAELAARQSFESEKEAARLNNEEHKLQLENGRHEAMARHSAAVEEQAKKTKLGDYWDDVQGTPARRILAALLIGGSSAVGGHAREIYDNAAANYRKKQEDILASATVRAQKAGADVAETEKQRERFLSELAVREEARDKQLREHLLTIPLRNPKAQAEADKVMAGIDANAAKNRIEQANRYDKNVHRTDMSTEVTGKPMPAGHTPSVTDQTKKASAEVEAAAAEKFAKFSAEHPKAREEVAKRLKDFAETDAQSELVKSAGGLKKALGLSPTNLMDKLSPEGREMMRGYQRMQNNVAAIKAGGGSVQAGELGMADRESGMGMLPSQELHDLIVERAAQARKIAGTVPAGESPAGPAPVDKGKAASTPQGSPARQERVEAAKWFKAGGSASMSPEKRAAFKARYGL